MCDCILDVDRKVCPVCRTRVAAAGSLQDLVDAATIAIKTLRDPGVTEESLRHVGLHMTMILPEQLRKMEALKAL